MKFCVTYRNGMCTHDHWMKPTSRGTSTCRFNYKLAFFFKLVFLTHASTFRNACVQSACNDDHSKSQYCKTQLGWTSSSFLLLPLDIGLTMVNICNCQGNSTSCCLPGQKVIRWQCNRGRCELGWYSECQGSARREWLAEESAGVVTLGGVQLPPHMVTCHGYLINW